MDIMPYIADNRLQSKAMIILHQKQDGSRTKNTSTLQCVKDIAKWFIANIYNSYNVCVLELIRRETE